MSRRDDGQGFVLGGKAYVWIRNTDGQLEAVSLAKVTETLKQVTAHIHGAGTE